MSTADQPGTGDGSVAAQRPARRLNQDYTNMYWYLSEPVWQMLKSQESQRTKAEHLCEHLYLQLQLRLPSEPSLGMATALVMCNNTDARNFDLRNALETVRSTWKSLYKRLQRSNPDNGMNLVPTLSRSMQDLPMDLQARVAAAVPPEQWPITETALGVLARRVSLRKAPAEKPLDTGAAMIQQFTEALAMYLPKNIDRQREPQTSLKNLQIFSPRSHLRGGNPNGSSGSSGLAQSALTDQMQLEQGRLGDSGAGGKAVQNEAALREGLALVPVRREPLSARENGSQALGSVAAVDGDCLRDASAAPDMMLTPARRGLSSMPARQGLLTTPARQALPSTPARQGLPLTPARRACEAGQGGASSSPFPLANEFVETRDKKVECPRGMKRPASAAGGAAAKKGTKKAGALKRPAASGKKIKGTEGVSRKSSKNVQYCNENFRAKGYGDCRVECYTAKSYIRSWCTQDHRWRMIIGATGPAHKEICHSLLQHVRAGMSREKLLTVRATIVERL